MLQIFGMTTTAQSWLIAIVLALLPLALRIGYTSGLKLSEFDIHRTIQTHDPRHMSPRWRFLLLREGTVYSQSDEALDKLVSGAYMTPRISDSSRNNPVRLHVWHSNQSLLGDHPRGLAA